MIKTKNGISLIVLVITIIVMIILAAAVIISLNNAGIIKTAHNAVCMTNIKQAQNLAVLVWSNVYTNPDEYTMDNVEQKLKEEFEKNGLKYEDYNVEVTKSGIEVSSKAGCTDTSGVEGGNGDSGSDTIPTNWEYAYAYDRTQDKWTAITVNEGTEPTGDVIVRMYNTGRKEKVAYVGDDNEAFATTFDTYDMVVSGTGEFELASLAEEDRILGTFESVDGAEEYPIELGTINLRIGEGITSVGESFEEGLLFLETVSFPSTLRTIKENAFRYCTVIQELTIPEGVQNIEREAFFGCVNIKSIILPDSLISLGEGDKNVLGAFAYCPSLESVTIPASLTRIPDYTFYDCDNLKTVNFKGTESQWNTILENSTHWSNDFLKTITVNYIGK